MGDLRLKRTAGQSATVTGPMRPMTLLVVGCVGCCCCSKAIEEEGGCNS